MAASRSRPRTTRRRPAGSASACRCSGPSCTCGCWRRRPASCCASMSAPRAAGIASPTPIGRPARRGRRSRCSRGRATPARISTRSARYIHTHEGAAGIRRILGVLSLAKNYGAGRRRTTPPRRRSSCACRPIASSAAISNAARRAAHAQASRPAHPPTHPLPRSHRSHDRRSRMNLAELDHALRKLRLSGMADVLEARLRQAQSEQQAPIDLLSALVGDELLRRAGSPHRAAAAAGPLSRRRPLARHLRLRLQQEDEPRADPRPRHRALRRAARGRALPRPAWHRQESSRAGDRPRRDPPGPSRPLSRSAHAARGDRRRHARRAPARTSLPS